MNLFRIDIGREITVEMYIGSKLPGGRVSNIEFVLWVKGSH